MSLQIKVPKEIREYEQIIMFGLTFRQLIWSGIGVVVGGLSFWGLKNILGIDLASVIAVVITVPFGLMGFWRFNGMNATEILVNWFKINFLMKPLKYKGSNDYETMFKDTYYLIELEKSDKNKFEELLRSHKTETEDIDKTEEEKKSEKGGLKSILNLFLILAGILILILGIRFSINIFKSNSTVGVAETTEKQESKSTKKDKQELSKKTTKVEVKSTTKKDRPISTSKKNAPLGKIPVPTKNKTITQTTTKNKLTRKSAETKTTVKSRTVATARATQAPAYSTRRVEQELRPAIKPTQATTIRQTAVSTTRKVEIESNDNAEEIENPIIETLPNR